MNKLRNLYVQLGFVDCFWYLVGRFLKMVVPCVSYHRYRLFSQKVLTDISRKNIHPSVKIRQVGEKEYQVDWFSRPKNVIASRFAQNAICFVAFKNDDPVACLWIVMGSYMEDEVKCKFVPTPFNMTAWDFDVYIKPEYRLGRVFSYLWNEANRFMRMHDIKWTMSRIDAFNTQSMRSHKRMGAVCLGGLTFIGFGKFQLMISTVHPFLHVSLSDLSYPEIKLVAPHEAKKK